MFNYLHTVVVVRPGRTVDRYNNEVPDWDAATRTTVERVVVCPSSQVEDEATGRTTVTTGWRLYSEPGTDLDIRAADRIEWLGQTLNVVGEVARYPWPRRGGVHHVDCRLEVFTG